MNRHDRRAGKAKQPVNLDSAQLLLEMISQMKIIAARLSRLERAMIKLHTAGLVDLDSAEIAALKAEHADMERRHDLLNSGRVVPGTKVQQ